MPLRRCNNMIINELNKFTKNNNKKHVYCILLVINDYLIMIIKNHYIILLSVSSRLFGALIQ